MQQRKKQKDLPDNPDKIRAERKDEYMKKILIVDDSAFMRGILKDILSNKTDEDAFIEEVEFFEADGKINAIKQLHDSKPDLILLDVVMRESETEGVEFIEEITGSYDLNKIIMISSIGQTAVLEKCKKLGIRIYLQKPFEHSHVIQAVKKVLA
jgi:two-component system chemotaxis response regulator CheY